MLRSLRAELQKAKRRHDLLACLLIPTATLVWAGYAAPDSAENLDDAFHALFYALPMMNTVLMPVGMAMLASRLWDVEIKGNFPKLLYTLQSRRSLFTAKVLLGIGEVILITILELAGALGLGSWYGYQDFPPADQILYYFLCTCTVSLMLFFSEMLLTILLANPLPALCVGITGALVGLFSGFMPPIVGYFVPWGYYIPLNSYILASWDPDTRIVVYGIRSFNYPLLIWCAALAIFFFSFTWRAIRQKEV